MYTRLIRSVRSPYRPDPGSIPMSGPVPVPAQRAPAHDEAGRHDDDADPGGGLSQAPWRALCPRGVVELRNPTASTLQRLASGTPVALVCESHLARVRVRRRARRAGIRVVRELVVVPSTSSPIVLLDETRAAVRHFWTSVAAVPPGLTRASAPATLALRLARVLPWRCTGLVAPGRVIVGVRR
jgi:hypothetical protein